ncbi:helix-turn-helix transcriptional regulator [Motilimonas sp. KMU-193]|uniref:helix-turn-helix transcriptional regulator n=1 Tax=Motilimonas sp. KMU-193 TaxID=3388668 RepID=UPI00396B2DB4
MDIDVYPFLRKAGLPEDMLQTQHQYIPKSALQQLLSLLVEKMGLAHFSVFTWRLCRDVYIPHFIRQLNNPQTVEEALIQVIEAINADTTQTRLSLRTVLGKTWFVRERSKANADWFILAEHFSVIFIIELVRALTTANWSPKEIAFQSNLSLEHSKLLLLKNTQLYSARSVTACSIEQPILTRPLSPSFTAAQTLKQPATISNFTESLILALTPYLTMGRLPITQASKILDMSVRSLQRRLAEEGQTYSAVMEQALQQQALAMLADPSIPITRIALSLGYSCTAHFSRAFKKQHGASPRQWRKNIIA